MWPQRWLGEAYSKLYWRFGREIFSLLEAARVLSFSDSKLHVMLSKLHSAGALIIFDRGRPRRYRLLDPRSLVMKMSGELREAEFLQEEYLQLTLDVLREVRARVRLVSFSVYGSVARGEAKSASDLDLLLISDDFKGSLASRIDFLSFVDKEVQDEVGFLRKNGFVTSVSFMPLKREEAEAGPILLLDPSLHARILYDQEGFLAGVLSRLRAKLDLAGAKRVETERGWYWDLKPDYRRGRKEEAVI